MRVSSNARERYLFTPFNSSEGVMHSAAVVRSIWWMYSTATAAQTGRSVANFKARETFNLLCRAAEPGVTVGRASDARYMEFTYAIAHHGLRTQDKSKSTSSLDMIIHAAKPSNKSDAGSVKAYLSQQLFTLNFRSYVLGKLSAECCGVV